MKIISNTVSTMTAGVCFE